MAVPEWSRAAARGLFLVRPRSLKRDVAVAVAFLLTAGIAYFL